MGTGRDSDRNAAVTKARPPGIEGLSEEVESEVEWWRRRPILARDLDEILGMDLGWECSVSVRLISTSPGAAEIGRG